ncbi:MAG: UDP-N-acetylmuramate--L-alanine ligase [Acidimicrobiia bacterium]|nr:UDP-N-acetylmuramate--L-alanine ligase [Acidimicrobiia bacterium]
MRDDTPAISDPRHIHVVGVGGAGMSAIAEVLAAMGHTVTGSDLKASAGLDRLTALGVGVRVGHSADHISGAELLTRSTAVPDRNSECRAAREAGIPVFTRAEILAAICGERETIAVAGTHGKTTTASMLALVLREAGLRPSFIIGGDVNEIGTGAAWDDGRLFVVEADESDGSFLLLPRKLGVVTNLEPDHLEHHGGYQELQRAFRRFVEETDGPALVGVDDEGGRSLAVESGAVSIGTTLPADWMIHDLEESWEGVRFSLTGPDRSPLAIELPLPGVHNARNAATAAAAGMLMGADSESVARALARFGGVARRFEQRGRSAGVVFVDDYAHLPTEVSATVGAARSGNWNRLVAVFQPHRYSRTENLWRGFAEVFDGVDVLFVTDVYPAGEVPRAGVSGNLIAEAVRGACPDQVVHYVPRREELIGQLGGLLSEGDLCLTMGAGDLTSVPDEVRSLLDARSGG